MKKKIFSTVLSAVLALSLCPAIALADTADAGTTVAEDNIIEDVASEKASTDVQTLADTPINALAADDIDSGTIGTCTWVIDSDGCLTIAPEDGKSGSFELTNPSGYYSWPWYRNRTKILSVKVSSGVSASGSLRDMFYDCSSITSLDLSEFDTSGVTDMRRMFDKCSSLTSLDLSGLDTSSVTDMSDMFCSCSSLTSLDLSSFDTSSVTDMEYMFCDCSFTSLDLSNFDTSNVTNMYDIFQSCHYLTSIDLSSFDTSSVTNMGGMFLRCSSLTSLDLSNFDTSSVTNMSSMFSSCHLTSLDLSNFDTSSVTDMSGMFTSCSLTSLDLSNFDTSSVTDMSDMFRCEFLRSLDVSNFDTSSVTNMGGMFRDCSSLTSLDLSSFDTSNVTNTHYMFYSCTNLRTVIVGEKFTLASSFPTPIKDGVEGKWMSDDGTVYDDPSDIPSNKAATYTAVFPESKTALEETIKEAEELRASDYTPDSWAALESALSVAKDVLADDNATQDEIDAATGALQGAINDLVPVSGNADKTELEMTIKAVAQLVESEYTPESWAALQEILQAAQRIDADDTATQSEVSEITDALLAAIDALQKLFTDVTNPNEWYYEYVYYMAELGVITGYENGSFGIGDPMTRADLVTIMWRYCEPDEYANYNEATAINTSGLPDVPDGTYYTGAVNWAVSEGVVTGNRLSDESYIFSPNDNVSFEQMVTIVARYVLGFDEAEQYDTSALNNGPFTDAATVSDYARGALSWAIENNVVTGNNNHDGTYTIAPLENVARERAATVLARSIQSELVIPN